MLLRLLCTVVLTFFSINIYSFTFTGDFNQGFYWKSFPIKFKVIESNQSEQQYLENLLRQAIFSWEDETGSELWEILSEEESTTNYVRWSYHFFRDTGYDANTTLGVTIRYHRGTFIERTEIILNGEMQFLKTNQGNILHSVILHELGHTLGLDHSSEPAIMQAIIGQYSSLQYDDVVGAESVIAETIQRQKTGYISSFALDDSDGLTDIMSCATISFISDDQGSGGGGSNSTVFLISIFLGIILSTIARVNVDLFNQLLIKKNIHS